MNAHFLKETIAQLFLFFSGVFLLENTVRLTKKSNGSIFWGADPIFWAVTAHARMSKNFFLLKWLVMNNHTPTHIMKLLLHYTQTTRYCTIWPGLYGRTSFHLSVRQPPSTFWYLLLFVARIRPWGRRSLFVHRSSSNNYGLSFMKWTVFRPPVINYHGPMSELLWSIVWIRPWREGFRVGLFMTWKVHLIHCLFIIDLMVMYTIMHKSC